MFPNLASQNIFIGSALIVVTAMISRRERERFVNATHCWSTRNMKFIATSITLSKRLPDSLLNSEQ